jgi:microcystin-dependent protein
MADFFVGQLMLVPYNFAPAGWALCHGQLLSISQHTALFSLLGTSFGGDGKTTFALPDLRGRVPISSGQGPGLANYPLGQAGGSEFVTITANQMPAHSHALNVHGGKSNKTSPSGTLLADGSVYTAEAANGTAANAAIGNAGSGQPHEDRQPYLTLNWIIALQGIFPARS